jgi:hypothetical protein
VVVAPFDVRADYAAAPVARIFRTLAEYQKATGQDLHSRLVGYDVLVNVPKPDAKDPQRIYDVRPLDFGLRKRSAAVDAGGAAERHGRVHRPRSGSRRARARATAAALRPFGRHFSALSCTIEVRLSSNRAGCRWASR